MKKLRRLKIRIDHSKSPLRLIRKKSDHPDLLLKGEEEIKKERDFFINTDRQRDLFLNIQRIIDEEKQDDTQYQLLKMMYFNDIDGEYAADNLGISEEELESIVHELVELGFLQFISHDEAKITEDGIKYIKSLDYNF